MRPLPTSVAATVLLAVLAMSGVSCGDEDLGSPPDATESTRGHRSSPETEVSGGNDAPAWYGQREKLPSCGVDEEYGSGYPNRPARECFREAFEAGNPAELTRVQYGDEGESIRAHFRVLGDGRYEIVGEQSPGPSDGGWDGSWVRYECDRFLFIEDPGSEVDGVPWIDAEGECTLVEEVTR